MGWTPEYYAANRERLIASSKAYAQTPEARNARLQKLYGISLELYDAMLDEQGHRCALCRIHCGDKKLDVDHDHETGRVRGLLCRSCNMTLGRLGDSVESVERVLAYMKGLPLGTASAGTCDSLLVQDPEVVAEAVDPREGGN